MFMPFPRALRKFYFQNSMGRKHRGFFTVLRGSIKSIEHYCYSTLGSNTAPASDPAL